jgi:hypothetical protein
MASQRALLKALADSHVQAVRPTANVASAPEDLRAS